MSEMGKLESAFWPPEQGEKKGLLLRSPEFMAPTHVPRLPADKNGSQLCEGMCVVVFSLPQGIGE